MTFHVRSLSAQDAEAVIEFIGRATELTQSKTAIRLAKDIAEETLRQGVCRVTHAEFGRRTGKCRRTIDLALKRIQALGLVEKIERTPEGRSVYRAVLGGTNGKG